MNIGHETWITTEPVGCAPRWWFYVLIALVGAVWIAAIIALAVRVAA